MKNIFAFISMFILVNYAKAQVNKVLNPSFEDTIGCPLTNNQIYLSKYWNGLDTLMEFNDQCKPDYYNSCSANFTPINNMLFNRNPKSGKALILSLLYFYEQATNTDIKDYARGKLISTLVNNKIYCGKFYVNLLSLSYYAVNKIGAYLDNGQLDTSNHCSSLDFVNAQIITNNIISDTTNWVKIENTFTSDGSENFITIGCFKNHFNVQALPINLQAMSQGSYYLIDDVSIIDISTPAFAGTDALIANGDSVYLGRPNEIGPECRWWANGAVVDSNLGFWAKPTQPTQYVLEQKICGNVKYDTVFVNISGHDGISPSPLGRAGVGLLPNPNNGSFTLSYKGNITAPTILIITDALGHIVDEVSIANATTHYQNNNLSNGLYFYGIRQNNSEIARGKILIHN